MKKPLTVLVAVMLQAVPAIARDMLDEKTHEYTPYGIAISLVAAAQVNEMSCKMKGQISLALAKLKRRGITIDLNDKEDFADVLFQATQIMTEVRKEGAASWCKARSAKMDEFLRSD
ncbi:hypothetical protein QA639_21430 [Bradyrhizobium pachyrhizi]|uniref:hypothetical protein n=1 Tax=Bradyrhizobium pachyrhizi TaxID=280333 RepID=UPI0024B19829|nr:hypothetical protein [Bradyrhizobium pachyrhizi]WFU52273.1 hypothetical protein QA639_21430 [Bradyrhizobium pachyrhizi]